MLTCIVYHFTLICCIAESHKRVSMTTFGSRLNTCYRVLQKERLLTYGVDRPGQSRGISPLQGPWYGPDAGDQVTQRSRLKAENEI